MSFILSINRPKTNKEMAAMKILSSGRMGKKIFINSHFPFQLLVLLDLFAQLQSNHRKYLK